MLSRESAAALIGGGKRELTPEEKMAQLPTKLKIKVVKDFYVGLNVVKAGETIELPYALAREMMTANRAVATEKEPPPVEAKDVSLPGAPSAATAKEADNVRKQDAARSQDDKQSIKDEHDAQERLEKRSKT